MYLFLWAFSCFTNFSFNQVHGMAIHLISYQGRPGRIFICASMICSLMSFGVYVYEASKWPQEVEKCEIRHRKFRIVDSLLNLFFLVHFCARFAAASDELVFWLEWYSILDYFTVVPTLLSLIMNRSWIGFRCLRVFRLVNLAEVLHNLNMIESAASLRLCQLVTFFIAVWFSGAGMMHLLENTGDPFGKTPYANAIELTYMQSLYYCLVTMSTVGYGDVTPQTVLGRAFACLFILFALATFASAIPEIADMLFRVNRYSGVYVKAEGRLHVVVCGDVTTQSVRHFLEDFLHKDRQRNDVEVVFINRLKPDLQLQGLLRRHFMRVKYLQLSTTIRHSQRVISAR
ncbi:unnamed protein product [Protopolystoma xenopodis]|uniref:BK channel n=1 Tax=Protopolystoma xenopodis TaxID=117903 RepID=A0A448XDZ3_9PLAT|nr:unnamed protein product [Protopolystoma xenopodis]